MNFLNIFNNREKAIAIWIVIFLIWVFSNKSVRTSFLGLIKAFFQKKIIVVVAAMLLYISLAITLLFKLGLWDLSLLKDSILWIFGIAFVLLMNIDRFTQDKKYFKKIVGDNLKLIVLIEFVVNLYPFSLGIELILIPVLVVIGCMAVIVGNKEEYKLVKKLIDSVLAFLGIFVIIFALYRVILNYHEFATLDNFKDFILTPMLMIIYLPFLYFLILFMVYENLFIRLDMFLTKDKTLIRFTKLKILYLCHINLAKLNKFAKNCTRDLIKLSSRNDVLRMINKFENK